MQRDLHTFDYDVALSFAGEDRQYAAQLADLLETNDIRVFFDEFEQANLWGKNLYEYFADIYANKACYCIMLLSKHYAEKTWPNHERQHAQTRAFKENSEYILPVRLDDTEIPGISETMGYLDLRCLSVEDVVRFMVEKLDKQNSKKVIVSTSTKNEVFYRQRIKDQISVQLTQENEVIFNKAVACFLLEDYDKARTLLAELAATQNNSRWLLNLGYLLYQQGDYAEALTTFRELINTSPYYVEAYLNSVKTCLTLGDHKTAKKFIDAVYKIAPERADVKKAKALFYLEVGDIKKFFNNIKEIPDKAIFNKPTDDNIERIKKNASIVIGGSKISVMICVFSNVGLRTILIGYKDNKNNFEKPDAKYKWYPMTEIGKNSLHVELIDHNDDNTSMLGYRINGLEREGQKEIAHGFLIADFYFENIRDMQEENYIGLLLVDYNKEIHIEPRQIFVKELLSVPEGDLIDLYQDMLFPKASYSVSQETNIPRVFFSYAREDYEIVEYLFQELKKRGIDTWKDDKILKIGESFEDKIEQAIEEADFAIVFLSSKSINKFGFIQKEFKKIIETAKYKPFGIPFALPIKLDNCKIPKEFSQYHWKELGDNKEAFLEELVQDIIKHYDAFIMNK